MVVVMVMPVQPNPSNNFGTRTVFNHRPRLPTLPSFCNGGGDGDDEGGHDVDIVSLMMVIC